MSQSFHHAFQTLDDAYQRSMVSFSTQTIAEKDEEHDQFFNISLANLGGISF